MWIETYHQQGRNTYRVLALVSADVNKRIVTFFNMDSEEMLAGKVFSAFQTPVAVEVVVVGFILGIGAENYWFVVRR